MAYKISIGTAIALCLSAIIGDTLFVVTGIPIYQAGSWAIIAFVIVGIIAIVIALQFGELGSIMPGKIGVAYSYVTRPFGTELGFITGTLLFFSYCAVVAAITFSFGGYLLFLFGVHSTAAQITVAAALIIAISLLNMNGVKKTAGLSRMLIVITIGAATIFCLYAVVHAVQHANFAYNFASSGSQNTLTAFGAAITTVVFAYAEFETVTTFTNNVKGRGKAMAKILIYSILMSIVAYSAIAIGLISLVPASKWISSSEPLLYALAYVNAPHYLIVMIGIGTLLAISAAAITVIHTASRIIYQLGIDGLLPKFTRKYDNERDTAINGIVITMVVSILLLFSGDLYQILSISNFGIIFSWIMACMAVISLRRHKKSGSFRMPLYPLLPIIGVIACIIFMLGLPRESLALGIAIILALLVLYYSIVEIRYRDVPRIKLFD